MLQSESQWPSRTGTQNTMVSCYGSLMSQARKNLTLLKVEGRAKLETEPAPLKLQLCLLLVAR